MYKRQAALGADIQVPTLEGDFTLTVPAGTPSGKVFRLNNRGIAVLGTGRRGDQLVRVRISVPTKIGDEQRDLLQRLLEIEGAQPAIENKGLFDKVKDIFG